MTNQNARIFSVFAISIWMCFVNFQPAFSDAGKLNEDLKKMVDERTSTIEERKEDRGKETKSEYVKLESENLKTLYALPFYAAAPFFKHVEGREVDSKNGRVLEFNAVVGFYENTFAYYSDGEGGNFSTGYDDALSGLDAARVYISVDNGNNWRAFPLAAKDKWIKHKKLYESWGTEISVSETGAGKDSEIMYFFRAQSNSGSVVTEVPPTNPGWPPNPAAFFLGVEDKQERDTPARPVMDEDKGKIPASQDLLDSFVARDADNFYVSFRTAGALLPVRLYSGGDPGGTHDTDPNEDVFGIPNVYGIKYFNPETSNVEGYSSGKWQLYAPVLGEEFNPFHLFNMNDKLPRIADACFYNNTTVLNSDINIGVASDTFFTRIPFKTLCPKKCGSLKILFVTRQPGIDGVNEDEMPFLHAYFRSHTISRKAAGAAAGGDAAERGLSAPNRFAPPPGETKVNDWTLWPDGVENIEQVKKYYNGFSGSFAAQIDYSGKGALRVKPCDIVEHGGYRFEIYTRGDSVKARIYEGKDLRHTIMINEATTPRRDEQHKLGGVLVKLSNYRSDPMSCDFEIVK